MSCSLAMKRIMPQPYWRASGSISNTFSEVITKKRAILRFDIAEGLSVREPGAE